MVLVDVGQLFRCAGHHFKCVTTGPPIRGDPISHSQAHILLKPLPPATCRKFFFPRYGVTHGLAQEPTTGSAVKFWGKSVRKNRPLVPRSNIAGSWTRGGGGTRGDFFGGALSAVQLFGRLAVLETHTLRY